MKQAVIVCTSGTRPASPNEGMQIYETDTDRTLTYTTATTLWRQPWNMPWGYLGYAQVVANQGSITTETDLTSLTVTVTVPANRRLRITGRCESSSTVADDYSEMRIKESTTSFGRAILPLRTVAASSTHMLVAIVNGPTAAAHTYKLTMSRSAGTGTITMNAASDIPAYILVEDIGPNSAPA